MLRLRYILVPAFSLCCGLSAHASPAFRSDEQRGWYLTYGAIYISRYSEPGYRLAAQCWQESRFNPNALNTSSGAAGECQFMQAAWGECVRGKRISRFNSRWSIKCASWYDRKLGYIWSSKRPEIQRWRLVLASYNAGAGNVIDAQKKCGMPRSWQAIAPCMEQVTGKHAKETIDYVRLIGRWYGQLCNWSRVREISVPAGS